MKQPRTRLSKVIADRTLHDGVHKDFVTEIAAYLITEKRTADLESVLRDIQASWAQAGHVEVVAASAHALTEPVRGEVKSEIRKLYPDAKDIIITEERDPEVIGGVRLKVANQQLDLTLEYKLNKFKQLTAA